jgi:hypothetical protein
MSQYVETPCRSFLSGGAIAQFARVKLSGGKLAACGADELGIGTIETQALAADQWCAVRLWNAAGTRKMIAAGPITLHADVYGAASGKIDDASKLAYIGTALEAATGDESIIEVATLPRQDS